MSDYSDGPVWRAFGLGRAAYFVAPRRSLQSMPAEWQQKFVDLMEEAHQNLEDGAFPDYEVKYRECGKFALDPMRDYRHTGPYPERA